MQVVLYLLWKLSVQGVLYFPINIVKILMANGNYLLFNNKHEFFMEKGHTLHIFWAKLDNKKIQGIYDTSYTLLR